MWSPSIRAGSGHTYAPMHFDIQFVILYGDLRESYDADI